MSAPTRMGRPRKTLLERMRGSSFRPGRYGHGAGGWENRRVVWSRHLLLLAGVVGLITLAVAPKANAGLSDEKALAARFAPVVRLVAQPVECGPGEPYRPLDLNLLFDN